MISALFADGRAVDLVLAVILVEAAFLGWRRAAAGGGRPPIDLFFTLAPGVCLLLALRGALTHGSWMWVAGWLALSFPVHIGDMLRRRL